MSGRHWEDFTRGTGMGLGFASCFFVAAASGQTGQVASGDGEGVRESPPRGAPEASRVSWVALSLDGNWPVRLRDEVVQDVIASLAERGVAVLKRSAEGAQGGLGETDVRGRMRIEPPDAARQFRVMVQDVDGHLIAQRDVSLRTEHPDTWSVAIAAAADELLAAAWSLPPRGASAGAEVVATTAEPGSAASSPEVAERATPAAEKKAKPAKLRPAPDTSAPAERVREGIQDNRLEVGLGGAGERYLPNAWVLGGELFLGIPVSGDLSVDVAVAGGKIFSRQSLQGEVTGRSAGISADLRGAVSRSRAVHLGWIMGVQAAQVWFDATAVDGAVAEVVTAQLLAVRAGGVFRVNASENMWLGARATAGVPLVKAEARDSFGPVLRLAGFQGALRVEVGWRL